MRGTGSKEKNMIYVGFLLIFALASFLDTSREEISLKSVSLLILFLITVFFIGLRYYTGSDWSGYINYFNTVSWDNNTYEFGYKLLNLFVKNTVNDYFFVQFLATFFFAFSVFRFYYKYNNQYLFLSIFLVLSLYFSELFMAQVRQSIAIGVLLFGTDFLLDRKWIKYCICVFIACLFHKTAVFALTFFLLCIDIPKYVRITVIILGLVLLQFHEIVTNTLFFISSFLPRYLDEMITGYLNSDRFGGGGELGSGLYFLSEQVLILIIVLLYTPREKFEVFILNLLAIYAFLDSIGLIYSIVGRIGSYIGLYAIISFTRLFEVRSVKEYREVFYTVFCLFLIYFILPFYIARTSHTISELTGRDSQYQYIPYYNVFFHPDGFYRKDWNE